MQLLTLLVICFVACKLTFLEPTIKTQLTLRMIFKVLVSTFKISQTPIALLALIGKIFDSIYIQM